MEKVIINEKDTEGNYIDGIYVKSGSDGKNYIGINASAINTGVLNIDKRFYANVNNNTVKIGGFTVDRTSLQWYQDPKTKDTSQGYVYLGQDGLQLGKDFAIDQMGNVTWGRNISPNNYNLIRNGFGENLDLTPFTKGTFIKASDSSINIPNGCYGYFSNDAWSEMIYYDNDKNYNLSFWGRADPNLEEGTYEEYFAVIPYDIDKNLIAKNMVETVDDITYELEAPLTTGSKNILIKNLSTWKSNPYAQYIGFFNYKDSKGHLYSTYTRNVKSVYNVVNPTTDGAPYRIILSAAYDGDEIPAGTKFKQMTDGNTYIYYGVVGAINNEWKYYQNIINKNDEKRLAVTKYIQLGFIYGKGILAGLSLTQSSIRNNIEDGIYVKNNKILINASAIKTGALEVSNSNGVIFHADATPNIENAFFINTGNFEITSSGTIKATDAVIDGTINASQGTIGKIIIQSDGLNLTDNNAYIKFGEDCFIQKNKIYGKEKFFIQGSSSSLIFNSEKKETQEDTISISVNIIEEWNGYAVHNRVYCQFIITINSNNFIKTVKYYPYINIYNKIGDTWQLVQISRDNNYANIDENPNDNYSTGIAGLDNFSKEDGCKIDIDKDGTTKTFAFLLKFNNKNLYSFNKGNNPGIWFNTWEINNQQENFSYTNSLSYGNQSYGTTRLGLSNRSKTFSLGTQTLIAKNVISPNDITIIGNIIPYENNAYNLGSNNPEKYWHYGFIRSINNGSDKKIKNNINQISNIFAENLIYHLEPKQFMFKNAKTPRYHYGFIAQEVEALMKSLNMTTGDNALICKSDPDKEDNENNFYSLNYIEFIPLLVSTIQSQNQRLKQLESQIYEIKGEN